MLKRGAQLGRPSDEAGGHRLLDLHQVDEGIHPAHVLHRADVVEQFGGNTVAVIAGLVATSPDRVREMIHRFNEMGMASLDPQWAGGRPRRITTVDEEFIVAAATTRPEVLGLAFTRWSLRKLVAYLADNDERPVVVSRERLRQILAARDVTFQRTKTWKESNDPDRDAKLDRIEEVVGAGNSAVVVDLPRCGPMLIRRVPNLVPIPGVTGSAHCALRPLEGPRDHRLAPPTRRAAPTGRPTRDHRRRPELARSDRGRATATEPSRVAGHPRHTVALAPPPHRRALDSTTATAGPAIDLSEASPTRAAPRSRESNLAIPPRPGRTRRARPPPRCVHGLGRSSTTPESTPPPHARKSPGRSSCGPRPLSPATSPPSKPSRCAGSTCCCASTSPPEPCTSQGPQTTQAARNLLLHYGHQLADAQALVRDRASQFIDAFDEIFRTERMKILKTPVRTPVANAFAERWIGTLRRELLDRTIIWNRRQLNKLVVDYIDHDNTHRPHRSLDQRPPVATDPPDQPDRHLQVVKTARCDGLINEYRNAA